MNGSKERLNSHLLNISNTVHHDKCLGQLVFEFFVNILLKP